jgi:hypothetical protein
MQLHPDTRSCSPAPEKDAIDIIEELQLGDVRLNKTGTGIMINTTYLRPVILEKAYIDSRGRRFADIQPYQIPSVLMANLMAVLNRSKDLYSKEKHQTALIYDTPMDFVKIQIEEIMRIRITEDDLIIRGEGIEAKDISLAQLVMELRYAAREYNKTLDKETRITTLSMEAVNDTASIYIEQMRNDRHIQLRKMIAYDPDVASHVNVDKFIEGLLAIYLKTPRYIDILMFKHMIWQIKRKIFALKRPYSLMYFMYSKTQGYGKTTFFQMLFKHFQWAWSKHGDIAKMVDTNNRKALINNKYLVDCQETALGGYEGTDLADILKMVIEEDTVSQRQMYGTTAEVIRNPATFVSTTNKHVWDVIKDTGMRRYWEWECSEEVLKADKQFFLQSKEYFDDILVLWRSIDETNNEGFYHPTVPGYEEVCECQRLYCNKHSFFVMLDKYKWSITKADNPAAVTVAASELLNVYNRYMGFLDPKDKYKLAELRYAIRNNDFGDSTIIEKDGHKSEVYYLLGYTKGTVK